MLLTFMTNLIRCRHEDMVLEDMDFVYTTALRMHLA